MRSAVADTILEQGCIRDERGVYLNCNDMVASMTGESEMWNTSSGVRLFSGTMAQGYITKNCIQVYMIDSRLLSQGLINMFSFSWMCYRHCRILALVVLGF